ncbi:unnamed protein product [Alopecurus aequalis]
MDISSAVDWWEVWQLRILVLGSLFVQYILLLFAPFRKYAITSWSRSIIWLSYIGSDAQAIYALATLFSRQRKQDYNTGKGNNILEVVWAPVLLMHLGGQDSITAYNIEDNELWKRHVLTAVSQTTVAIYVFCKSWPGGDKRLLQVVLLLFTPGILKCLEKPWALKSASFNSLVSLSKPASHFRKEIFNLLYKRKMKTSRRSEAISLEEYVQKAMVFDHTDRLWHAQEKCDVPQDPGEPIEVDLEGQPSFDESVLLWHIATDLCFYQQGDPSVSHENSMDCREISNYMMYLLVANPEMLLPGTRRNLFMEANAELEEIPIDDKPLLKKILKGDKPSFMEILKGNKSYLEFLKGKEPSSEEIEGGFMQRIIANLKPTEHDNKMWEVIEGVWMEMLCFSASRCRGYLHAKSMGSGVVLLTYVWFLLSRMGMETLPERLQRTELPSGEGNAGAPPSTSQIHAMEDPTRFRRSRSH